VAGDLLNYFARRVDTAEDAAELLAETLFVAWRRIDALPADDESCRMWMFVTARKVLSNWRRGRKRRFALSRALREQLLLAAPAHGAGSDEPDAELVRAAVKELPLSQRELIVLVDWDGFSVVDAAAVLGVRETTARGRYQRAVTRLRHELTDRGRDLADPAGPQRVFRGES
jgi:RNA polymerase sigma-70 factor (ECF subfamily)